MSELNGAGQKLQDVLSRFDQCDLVQGTIEAISNLVSLLVKKELIEPEEITSVMAACQQFQMALEPVDPEARCYASSWLLVSADALAIIRAKAGAAVN